MAAVSRNSGWLGVRLLLTSWTLCHHVGMLGATRPSGPPEGPRLLEKGIEQAFSVISGISSSLLREVSGKPSVAVDDR